MNALRSLVLGGGAAALLAFTASLGAGEIPDPAEITLGERLFLETRFAEHFRTASRGDVNAPRIPGDPALRRTETTGAPLPGPFAGQSMNCRACHLVDEQADARGGGIRTYADFAKRSPIPDRGDGLSRTLRNAPSLVDATFSFGEEAPFLHFDGEFATPEDLVVGTFTGRNYGWLPGERAEAIAHIARVLRRDDGTGELAQEFGGSYRRILRGTSPGLPPELRLPPAFRIDPDTADDETLVRAAARLVAEYMRALRFRRDEKGLPESSSYDLFLKENNLPRRPAEGESAADYTDRLRDAVESLARPRFISRRGVLEFHHRPIRFGRRELEGLRAFLRRPADAPQGTLVGIGNCASCHVLPSFTDRRFHATGVSQLEYDGIHGDGAFAALPVPTLAVRNGATATWLPPNESQPAAAGPFASIPDAGNAGRADLGLWNVFANPFVPGPQAAIRAALGAGDDETLLSRSLAAFKTPSLRDLGQSPPFMHDGARRSVGAAVRFYVTASDLARAGNLRNADPAMAGIRLDDRDVSRIAAFLRALDEDYD